MRSALFRSTAGRARTGCSLSSPISRQRSRLRGDNTRLPSCRIIFQEWRCKRQVIYEIGQSPLNWQQSMLSPSTTEFPQMSSITRRNALMLGAGLTLTLVTVDPLMATPDEAAAEINKFTGGKATEAGKISIDLPEIAENGNTVPLSIKVDSAVKADDYVSEIRDVADGNPFPGIVRFHLTPMAGRAEVSTRIRLNSTENVIVLAKTSTGKLYMDRRMVKVTVGGCGG